MLQACQQKNVQPSNEIEQINPININQKINHQENEYTNREIADHLATISAEVTNVNDAIAIIAGPYAVVGIDIDATTERQHVGTIKYSVSEALQHDPYGKTAVVIADADIVQRIEDMKYKMEQGHPIQGVTEELAEIVSRYVPVFPINDNILEEPQLENEPSLNKTDDDNPE